MNPGEWEDFLRDAHNEPLDPAHYTAVRARVLSSVGLRPAQASEARWWRFAWLTTAAAILLILAALRPSKIPPPPRITLAIPPAPAAPAVCPRPLTATARTTRPDHQPITIKLQTSDPNIVIYWIAD